MDLVAIAVIKRAVGLDGLCGAMPYGETFGRLKTPVTVYVGESEYRVRETTLERVEQRPQGPAARFSDVRDRTEAEGLQGCNIYIREEQLPELGDGAYYHFRLKGMAVVSESSGGRIGVVRDTVKLPSTDALEVALSNGRDIIIPYNDQAVVGVDDEKKVIVVSDSYIEELL
jgi:16S rRNA processing protein RimM